MKVECFTLGDRWLPRIFCWIFGHEWEYFGAGLLDHARSFRLCKDCGLSEDT